MISIRFWSPHSKFNYGKPLEIFDVYSKGHPFNALKSIDLSKNKIDTLELISQFKAPILESLSAGSYIIIIDENEIISMTPLIKLESREMKVIQLSRIFVCFRLEQT